MKQRFLFAIIFSSVFLHVCRAVSLLVQNIFTVLKEQFFFSQVESFNRFVRVGGTSMGGGTFWGLGSLLTSAKV